MNFKGIDSFFLKYDFLDFGSDSKGGVVTYLSEVCCPFKKRV